MTTWSAEKSAEVENTFDIICEVTQTVLSREGRKAFLARIGQSDSPEQIIESLWLAAEVASPVALADVVSELVRLRFTPSAEKTLKILRERRQHTEEVARLRESGFKPPPILFRAAEEQESNQQPNGATDNR